MTDGDPPARSTTISRPAFLLPLLTLALLAVPACDDPGDGDGDDDDSGSPCEDGWREDGENCVPEACGTGTWGNLDPGAYDRFVDAGADDGGDGSRDHPFRTLTDAVDDALDRGGAIAVAGGTYTENLHLTGAHDGISLAGRCPQLVILDGSDGDDVPGVEILGNNLGGGEYGLSGMTVRGAPNVGIWLQQGQLTMDRVIVADNRGLGIFAYQSSSLVILRDSTVSGTLPDEQGSYGRGIDLLDGARLEATDCLIEGNTENGVRAKGSSTSVLLLRVTVRGTVSDPDGGSPAVSMREGAELVAQDCLIEGNAGMGLTARDAGTEAVLSGVQIRDTLPDATGAQGWGIEALEGARLLAQDCAIEGSREVGLIADGEGTEVELHNVTISGTTFNDHALGAAALYVVGGAAVTGTGCTVTDNVQLGVLVSGIDSQVTLTDTTVADTALDPDGEFGFGAEVLGGALLRMTSSVLERNHSAGVVVNGLSAMIELDDVVIRDTRPAANGMFGRAAEVALNGGLTATNCRMENNQDTGISVAGVGTTVTLTDVEISGTQRASYENVSAGIGLHLGSIVNATRVWIHDTEGPGLVVIDDAQMSCTDCDLLDNSFAGAVVIDAQLTLLESRVEASRVDANLGGGIGVYVENRWAPAPQLLVSNSEIGAHALGALWAHGHGSYRIEDSALAAGPQLSLGNGLAVHGNAVFATETSAWDDTVQEGLLLVGNQLTGAESTAILLDAATATLETNTYQGNIVDVQQQRCAGIDEPVFIGEAPNVSLCPEFDEIVAPVEFHQLMIDLMAGE